MNEQFGIIKIDADYDYDVKCGDIFYCKCPFCEDENIVSVEYLDPLLVCAHFAGFDPQVRTFLFVTNSDIVDETDEDVVFDEEDFEDFSPF